MSFLAGLQHKIHDIAASLGISCSFLCPWMSLACMSGAPFCSPPAAEWTASSTGAASGGANASSPVIAGPPAPKRAKVIEANYFARLQELMEWRRSGLLADTEFENAKRKLGL